MEPIESMPGYKKMCHAFERLNSVRDIRDLEAIYLRGDGLTASTYATYRQAVSAFCEFTNHLNPLQVTPGHIEQYYDSTVKRTSKDTASGHMAALKKFFSGIVREIPIFESPFDKMSNSVKKKISRKSPKGKTKTALTLEEWEAVKTYLKSDKSLKGLQNRAMILTLYSTGLRAFELCNLKWSDLSQDEGGYHLKGVGKGAKAFTQFLPETVVTDALEAFTVRFKRKPRGEDSLFYSLESYHGKPAAPMCKSTLWVRLRDIGKELKEQGKIRKEIEFSAHLFRRSFITHLNKKGVDIKTISHGARVSDLGGLYNHYIDNPEPPQNINKLILQEVAR